MVYCVRHPLVYVSLFIFRYVCTYTRNALNNKKVTISHLQITRLENSYIKTTLIEYFCHYKNITAYFYKTVHSFHKNPECNFAVNRISDRFQTKKTFEFVTTNCSGLSGITSKILVKTQWRNLQKSTIKTFK